MRAFVVAVALFACLQVALCSLEADREAFLAFQAKYSKTYSADEYQTRFAIFRENLRSIEEKNAAEGSAVHGVTKFSDLTVAEFKEKYLMKRTPTEKPTAGGLCTGAASTIPSSFDWRDEPGVVTPIKNQGQCGSCWAFSATENIESVWARAGHPLTKLSEQQIVDCSTADYGCQGGWSYQAFAYVISAGGIESEADYPYTARDGTCAFHSSDVVAKINNYCYVTQSENEETMAKWLVKNNPLSVCVYAESWMNYQSGVFTNCGYGQIDHCVEITGYGVENGVPFWWIRNSWGSDWGINGYMKLARGHDTCHVAEVVTSALE